MPYVSLLPLRLLQQLIQRVLNPQRVRERPPLEDALKRCRSAGVVRFEFKVERVDDVVEEVRLADGNTAEVDVGEVDLRRRKGQSMEKRRRSEREKGRDGRCGRGSDL